MDANTRRFHERLQRIEGASAPQTSREQRVRPDGLIVTVRRRRGRLRVPWRSLMLALTCCFLLKAGLIWHQGEAAYAVRLAALQDQSQGHRVAAWLLATDPVSVALARQATYWIGPAPH